MSKKAVVIGDVHGAWGNAEDIINEAITKEGPLDLIIQVGDMGFGMPGVRPWTFSPPCPSLWIDGNHENYFMLNKRDVPNFGYDPYHILWPQEWATFLETWEYMPRGTVREGILFIGGAASIDRHYRTEGVDWWPEENISYQDEERTLKAIEEYDGPIHTVISHTCPLSFRMAPVLHGPEFATGNRKFLEHIRQVVMPQRWYFGHFHVSLTGTFEGCEWRCLDMAGGYSGIDYAAFEF